MAGVDTGLENCIFSIKQNKTVAFCCSRLHLKTGHHLPSLSTFLHRESFMQGVAQVCQGLTLDWNTAAIPEDGTELGLNL